MGSRLHAQEDVQVRLRGLRNRWEELNHRMAERGDQLQEARRQDQLRGLLQVSQRGHWREIEHGLGWEQVDEKGRSLGVLLTLEQC